MRGTASGQRGGRSGVRKVDEGILLDQSSGYGREKQEPGLGVLPEPPDTDPMIHSLWPLQLSLKVFSLCRFISESVCHSVVTDFATPGL